MSYVLSVLVVALMLTVPSIEPLYAQNMEKVRVAVPSHSLSALPYGIAKEKGIFRAEGLDVELVQMATSLTVTALATKDVDYSNTSASAVRAALRGLPIRVVLFIIRRPLHVLVVRPEIMRIEDLKGKTIAIQQHGDATATILQAIVEHGKLDMRTDVTAFPISRSGDRLLALTSGKVDGAIIAPPFNVQAEAHGFRRLIAGADIIESGITGLNTHIENIQKNPAQVKRMIRALLKAQSFIAANKEETIKTTAEWLKQDLSIANGGYEIYIRAMSADGLISDQAIRRDIEAARLSVNAKHENGVNKVIDFTILREALGELKISLPNQ
jgi:NitT/TauT family transport system substrate-binding protein